MKIKTDIVQVKQLLRYDWINNRKSLLLMFGVIEIIYFICIGICIWVDIVQGNNNYSNLTNFVMSNNGTFFTIMNIAVIIRMTKYLHRKINHRQNSIPFVMIPAGNAEKVATIHLSYLAGLIFSIILSAVNILAVMAIASLISPEAYQMLSDNIFGLFRETGNYVTGMDLKGYASFFLFMILALNIFFYILYLNINLAYKKNPQPKSIITIFVLGGLYIAYISKIGISLLSDNIKPYVNIWEIWVYPLLIIPPIIALFFSFYYQFKEKEIR